MVDDFPGDYRLSYRGITFILTSPNKIESDLISGTATPLSVGGSSSNTLFDTNLNNFETKLVAKRIFLYLG